MSKLTALGILVVAALLEAGGDALMRVGIHHESNTARWLSFLGGAILLFAYGFLVNKPSWDFGKSIGIYVVFFFLMAQLNSWIFFRQKPAMPTWIGGALIVAGGIVMTIAGE